MAITFIQTDFIGESGVTPRLVRITCDDPYATVISQNYLQSARKVNGYTFYPTDFFAISYSGGASWFNVTLVGDTITLFPTVNPGIIPGAFTPGNLAVFSSTPGQLVDLGFSPSNPTKSKLASVFSATVAGNLLKAQDVVGTIGDAGISANDIQSKSNIVATTASYAGGSASFTMILTGIVATSIVSLSFRTQANPSSILTVVPTMNTLNIVTTADPGASTFNLIVFLVPQ